MKIKPVVKILNLGRKSFNEAYKIQTDISKSLITQIKNAEINLNNTLVLVEHDPVYTIGIRTSNYTREDEIRLTKLGAEFIKTNRGGLITFHGPGQLVIYPILYLGSFNVKKSMRWYISQLEKTVIRTCGQFGITSTTTTDTGVWIGDKKIAAIGVHGSRHVTMHGTALNCNTDLTWFDHIVPCGIPEKGVTSLSEELNRNITIEETTPIVLDSFRKEFNCELVNE